VAHHRHLGEAAPGAPREGTDPPWARPTTAQRWHLREPERQEHRGRWGAARGYDGGKKIKGRKRHLLVDTQGLVLKVKLHAASVMDRDGIKPLLKRAKELFARLSHLWLDAGYNGRGKGKDWVEKTLGLWAEVVVRHPPKPRYVWVKEGEEPDWEKLRELLLPPPRGFRVLPRGGGSSWRGPSLGSTRTVE
jgi:hypothetical protein